MTTHERKKCPVAIWSTVLAYHLVSNHHVSGLSIPSRTRTSGFAQPICFDKRWSPITSNGNKKRYRSLSMSVVDTEFTGDGDFGLDTNGIIYNDVDGIGGFGDLTDLPPLMDTSMPLEPVDFDMISEIDLTEDIIESEINTPTIEALLEISPSVEDSCNDIVEVKEPPAKEIPSPDVRKIIKFAIPAIGVWLCSPILSLIDTAAVGLLSGTAQQAALNPAVAVTEYSALLMAFMYTGTTNLIAGAEDSDRAVPGKPRTASTFKTALQLSSHIGALLGSILIVFSRPILRGIIGNDTIDPVVFAAALRYVRIRALGMPAAVVIGSAQAASLGMKDIRSPLFVLLAAAVVNFLGDVSFVWNKHPWIGGAAGAAWATVISQYAAMFLFMKWLQSTPKPKTKNSDDETLLEQSIAMADRVNLTESIMEMTSPLSSAANKEAYYRSSAKKALKNLQLDLNIKKNAFQERRRVKKAHTNSQFTSTRGFLAGKLKLKDLITLPELSKAKEFFPYFLPVTSTSVGRVSSYIAMSHVISSSIGTLEMAAQQVILSFFYCLTPMADSLNLIAQSFVPGIFGRKKSKARTLALKKTTFSFIKAGFIFSAAMMACVASMPILGHFFTTDTAVLTRVNSVLPILAAVFSVHGVICAMEGVLLGQKDLSFLGGSYASYFFIVPYFMLRVKKSALAGNPVGLQNVWNVFFFYQIARIVMFLGRAMMLLRKANKEDGRELSPDTKSL